jgi:hypothetical protein
MNMNNLLLSSSPLGILALATAQRMTSRGLLLRGRHFAIKKRRKSAGVTTG